MNQSTFGISPSIRKIVPTQFCESDFEFGGVSLLPDGVFMYDTNPRQRTVLKRKFMEMSALYSGAKEDVGKSGIKTGLNEVGSTRWCNDEPELAGILNQYLINGRFLELCPIGGYCGVSTYFRYMEYLTPGAEHYPHIDSNFGRPKYMTLYSFVLYCEYSNSGELAFLPKDPNIPDYLGFDHRFDPFKYDVTEQMRRDQASLIISPRIGRMVIFPHHLYHAVLPLREGEERRVIRGDLVFNC